MGRPAKLRAPIQRALAELLAEGPMPAREVYAAVRERIAVRGRMKASNETIRQWAKEICVIFKRGRPGASSWWWKLSPKIARTDPKITGIDPKITGTNAMVPGSPKIMPIHGGADAVPKPQPRKAQHAARDIPPKTAGTHALSLLDGHPRSEGERNVTGERSCKSQRQAALGAFVECLERWGWPLHTITLTTASTASSEAIAPRLAVRVHTWDGGIWLVRQVGESREHVHFHGLTVGIEPQAAIDAWMKLADGAATADWQHAAAVDYLPGWLDYCRREPGFDPLCVIASGKLYGPWSWALGSAGYLLPRPPSTAEPSDWELASASQRADAAAALRVLGTLAERRAANGSDGEDGAP